MSGASSPSADGTGREPFMGFAVDEASCAALVRAAAERGWGECPVIAGDVNTAIATLATLPTPELLVVDVAGSADPLADLNRLAEVCDAGTRVIALGAVNDVELFRRLRDAGIEDYLVKPVRTESVVAALGRAGQAERPAVAVASPEASPGRLVLVIGARGGVGATTVAVNAAWWAANHLGKRTALVDLDLVFGGVALALDLDPGRGFREAMENPSRIDDLFLERALVKDGSHLSVLAAEDGLDQSPRVEIEAVEILLGRLRKSFDLVVVELPRALVGPLGALLEPAAAAAVVTDLSLSGMRDTLRLRRFLKDKAPRAAVLPVIGRLGAVKAGALGVSEFEKGIEAKLAAQIPQDDKAAGEAAAQGKPLVAVAAAGKAGAALIRLAGALAGVDAAGAAPWWRRLVKG